MIVKELTRLQHGYGYLPRQELVALAERFALPLYRIQEVVSFFPHFRTEPPADIEVQVCRDMSCHQSGSVALRQQLELAVADQIAAGKIRVCGSSCLGRCDRVPAVRVSRNEDLGEGSKGTEVGHQHGHELKTWLGRTADEITTWVRQLTLGQADWSTLPDDRDREYLPEAWQSWRIVARDDQGEPLKYAAVRRFCEAGATAAEGDRIIAALETAGLLGMGGAGGRAYKKWSEVREAVGARKFVVCNADESEPGTFKDRELLLRAPHLIVEAVVLAGLVIGAERGYIYVRHEYEEQIAALEAEIAAAQAAGFCGEDILGRGRSFPVEVFVSPGGYICGEQTALIEAMEDKRAEPRNRPPELQTNGLWDLPTLLNNVETLAWVPSIVLRDEGRWYAQQAAQPSFRGARFFSISGDVVRPGVYEVPIGITLGQLIDEHAGGLPAGRVLRAVALSGPSGGFVPARLSSSQFATAVAEVGGAGATEIDIRSLPLDIALFRKLNLMLGAGIVVYAEGTDLLAESLAALRFFQAETCGKCVPCRLGTTKLVEWAEDLLAGRCGAEEAERWMARDGKIVELSLTMRQTAICGLGTVAANPLTSVLAYFPEHERRG